MLLADEIVNSGGSGSQDGNQADHCEKSILLHVCVPPYDMSVYYRIRALRRDTSFVRNEFPKRHSLFRGKELIEEAFVGTFVNHSRIRVPQDSRFLPRTHDRRVVSEIVFELGVIRHGQKSEAKHRAYRSYYDKGSPPSVFRLLFVGNRSEKRYHKQSEYVVESHNHARPGLIKSEFVDEHYRNDSVVRLPEGAYQKECEPYENRFFVIELHTRPPRFPSGTRTKGIFYLVYYDTASVSVCQRIRRNSPFFDDFRQNNRTFF